MKRLCFLLYFCFTIFLNSALAGGISGTSGVCLSGTATHAGQTGTLVTYSAVGFSNPTYYRWSVTGINGARIYGTPLESSCQVFFPNSMIDKSAGTVTLNTSEGSASLNFTVFVPPPAAGRISGTQLIDLDKDLDRIFTYSTPAIPNVTLVWGPPAGATIVSQGTNSVALKFQSTFRGGH